MPAALPLRIGLVGLDSTHAIAFTQLLNRSGSPALKNARVIAACSGAPTDFPLSKNRALQIRQEFVREFQLPIADSFAELNDLVDSFLLLTADGRNHLKEARVLFSFGKPVFIDKPLAASFVEAADIFHLAALHHVPCFSSSALRFRPGIAALQQAARTRPAHLEIVAPLRDEPGHPSLLWHGIHAVETLFAVFGPGCDSVVRKNEHDEDITVLTWHDGSTGTLIRRARGGEEFPVTVQPAVDGVSLRGFSYETLLEVVVAFFITHRAPVSVDETLEIFRVIEAADVSAELGGDPVKLTADSSAQLSGPVATRTAGRPTL